MEPLEELTTVRVMVFNIEDGGVGVDLAKVVEAIRWADPDIVALEEAMGNTARIADALGWGFASARTHVLSRHPIVEPADGDGVFVFVEIRPGRIVAVANVHLPADPYGPHLAAEGGSPAEVVILERCIRLPVLERHLTVLPRLVAAGIPVFLAGDFNAPSHLDWIAASVGLRTHLRAPIDWPVSRAIEAAGFRDTWRDIHPDPVVEPGLTWWAARPAIGGHGPGHGEPEDRIDVIYAAGPSTTLDSRIVGEVGRPDVAIGVEPWPSDHRAVVSTFQVSPAPMPVLVAVARRLATTEVRGSGDPVQLRVTRPSYQVGEEIEVAWTGGPGNRWDWIAVFRAPADELDDAHLIWAHTGARVAGTVRLGASSAVVDQSSAGGRWPLPPGAYEAAYLLDDATVRVARAAFAIVA
ncbi:MAG: endonuclease/exonuclease/phosphatase family protein [Candidatus Limnocylindrales bacterium]